MSSENVENKNNTTDILNNTIRTLFDRVIENKKQDSNSNSNSNSDAESSESDTVNNRKWKIIHNLAESQNHLCQMFLHLMDDADE